MRVAWTLILRVYVHASNTNPRARLLPTLLAPQMAEYGVRMKGHRKRIARLINDMRAEAAESTANDGEQGVDDV